MKQLYEFCVEIKRIISSSDVLSVEVARNIVRSLNNYLYTNYPGIGETHALNGDYEFFSDFHKFWKENHEKILDCKISDAQCEKVADALYAVYVATQGEVFEQIYDTCGLEKTEVCRVRFLTANQDFRGSLNFEKLAKIYQNDNSIFDEELINQDPAKFIREIELADKSQNDKRNKFAKRISQFLLDKGCEPYDLIDIYERDIYALRNELISYEGAGYGNKKTDMFLRDMVVLKIWENVKGFDKLDVASDVNTIKVALRTGILETAIPLVSSFLDIFCYQYEYVEKMNARAWRRVWEIWKAKYPIESVDSPCMIDYFVYDVIGRQFCRDILCEFECDKEGHRFKWHSSRKRTCQICNKQGKKGIGAKLVRKIMPCIDDEGGIAFSQTAFAKSVKNKMDVKACPFRQVCGSNRVLLPPKSISILGQTGWTTAYTRKDIGGGGLMS